MYVMIPHFLPMDIHIHIILMYVYVQIVQKSAAFYFRRATTGYIFSKSYQRHHCDDTNMILASLPIIKLYLEDLRTK